MSFWTKKVLCLAFAILAVGVDEEDVFESRGVTLVHHQHTGQDARSVEEPGRQADDSFQPAGFDKVFPRLFFFAAPEQHTDKQCSAGEA